MKNSAIVFIGLALLILSALFFVFKPQPPPQAPTTVPVQRFAFTVTDGQRVHGPEVMEVAQGSRVTLEVTSDHTDELHVHGYDLARALPAGETVSLSFPADTSGRFTIELHGAHQELSVLQVQPR